MTDIVSNAPNLKFRFNEALEFPCDQHMRIIVENNDNEPQHLVDVINSYFKDRITTHDILDSRQSSNGKYVSYTVRIRFQSALELETLYENLAKESFVKHVL